MLSWFERIERALNETADEGRVSIVRCGGCGQTFAASGAKAGELCSPECPGVNANARPMAHSHPVRAAGSPATQQPVAPAMRRS